MLKTADFKTCAQIQPKRGWCFVRKLFLLVFLCLFPIFSFSATLPSGYTQLEYIELDHAYLDTGIVLNDATANQNLKLHITTSNVAWTASNTSNHLMGCANISGTPRQDITWGTVGNINDATHSFMLAWFSFWGTTSTRWVGTNASGQSFDLYTKYRLDIDGLDATITNVDTNTVIGTHTFTDTPIAMVNDIRLNGVKGLNSPYNESYNIARFYDFEIEGIAHMIPAKNTSGVVGMYDTVRNQFYTKSSSGGTITAGPVVLPSEYTQLEYIESTSFYQYIDTGIQADKNTEVEMVAKTNGSDVNYLFGTEGSGDTYMIAQTGSDGTLIFDFHERSPNPDRIKSSVLGYDDFHKIEVKNQSFYVDDMQIGSFASINNFTATRNSYLVGVNGDNYNYVNSNISGTKIKYCKIWQSGTLVRDFVPVQRNSDGAIGMYDYVTNTFYTNSGMGAFSNLYLYTQLEYLELQGEVYFNTNVYLSKDMDIEYEIMLTQRNRDSVLGMARSYSYGGGFVFASNTTNTLVDFFGIGDPGRWVVLEDPEARFHGYVMQMNKKYKVSIINKVGTFYEDDTILDTYTYIGDAQSPNIDPFYINARSDQGNVVYENGNLHMRVYGFKATGVADIIPVKRNSDNKFGFLNKTTNEFIPSIGSGTIIAGPAISLISQIQRTVAITWSGAAEPDASGMCVYGETFTAPSTAPTAPSGLKFLGWRPM